ncbi:GNAT family N-acetyltransferase [Kaistia dalseonensis]|uniref:CelD/BcsL family acetyltransferase involved in cellulose biosynthesis n=1 Tax=Kaistia dalseonensis TaxID=410840 RepID=A0ABU0H8D8_9HYPH|nr:GNAT family N-acetyltransferase [Kaistia dalseonensis]MCX5495972.1 GNAT family N-acetyltransferase [Kaistia dalseonensis]MDQ0438575.1 CelD/BcsL family acetyltransferase involved in cellulose biosynthesis [Kaistia dalseonensis]
MSIHARWSDAADLWRPLFDAPQGSPFQSARWLARWYETFGSRPGVTPVLVHVADAAGRPALGLPLVIRKVGGLRQLEFADLDVSDYNAPLAGIAAPQDRREALALWAAIRKALPAADCVLFEKMLPEMNGRPNPLALALPVRPSSLFGSYLRVETDWEGWLRAQDKHLRKELGRFWRVFTRDERARFDVITDLDEALRRYGQLEIQQSARIKGLGLPYLLDDPLYAGFYRALLRDGLDDGSVIFAALTAGDKLVAGLLGVASGDHLTFVRISAALDEWSNCSPGRLVIERSMEALSRGGFRTFDFGIGDYPYKRSFGPETIPLVELYQALSWRGRPAVALAACKAAAKAGIKRHPALERFVRRLMGRAA